LFFLSDSSPSSYGCPSSFEKKDIVLYSRLLFSPAPPELSFLLSIFRVYGLSKDFAAATHFHLLGPAPLGSSAADRAIDEPAEVAQVEFPSRACLSIFWGTVPDIPAGTGFPGAPLLGRYQKKSLPFNVDGNLSPSLFETLHGLE